MGQQLICYIVIFCMPNRSSFWNFRGLLGSLFRASMDEGMVAGSSFHRRRFPRVRRDTGIRLALSIREEGNK